MFKSHSEMSEHAFAITAVNIWNRLPASVQSVE